ncbi:MAG TPA: HlyD family efflux transporter periplasmic adaptor subunit [Gemmatimonadaceae bacterium]|nr:HlyD family efflux transporter periplasmic adaptor subunit [Gemmatimonadaceae bacterium]
MTIVRHGAGGLLLAVTLVAAGCNGDAGPDAYGNFETTDVVVSAETGGRLLWFAPSEGATLEAGELAAVIDTTQLALERDQIAAQRAASTARSVEADRQIQVLEAQREITRRAYERTRRLHEQQAATAQQLDQTERDYRVLDEQIGALRAQRQSVRQEAAASEARLAQIRDRVERSRIINPVSGTVLATYAERGELMQAGQPLYRIANLDSMVLRAYVTEPQLARVRIGQQVRVSVDDGGQLRALPGRVTWVSSEAEFTPTPIQTREERADLVYAVKITVANQNGVVKIGMPGDVTFGAEDDR